MFAEDRLGMLKPGYEADLTVIDRDPFQVSAEEVLRAKVLMTVIAGEVVYQAP
jgi:hypothetical protein